MLRCRDSALCLLAILAGCTKTTPTGTPLISPPEPQETVLSDEALRADNARHLPTDNWTGRIEPIGDLLQKLSQIDPKNPELHWFQRLPSKMQQEVVDELNHYSFRLIEKLVVKARLDGDYDMRWRFIDPAPTQLVVEPAKQLTGESRSVQVTFFDLHTDRMPRDANDCRSLKAHFVWQPDPSAVWTNGDKLAETRATFTLPIHYSADCEILNRVPRFVDALDSIYKLVLLPDGSAQMTMYPDEGTSFGTVRLALNGKGENSTVIAKPGDVVAVYLVDALGAGAFGYTYLGANAGKLRFESHSWFYEIGPASRQILEVLPYSQPPEKNPATAASQVK